MISFLKTFSFVFIIGLCLSCQNKTSLIKTDLLLPETVNEKENKQIKAIEKLIQERVDQNNIPALSVGLIKNNKILSYHNIGHTTRGSQKKVDEHTIYQLASLSKTFTGIITKELIAEGKVDLNASISIYLPNSLSEATLKKLTPVTIRDLLMHKSGFPRDAEYAKRPWQFLDGPMVGGYSEEALLKDLEELTLKNAPGKKWEYSNLGFGTMGYILERASGIPLSDLYEKYLADKYGMKKTTMDLEKAKQYGMATPYMKWWRSIQTSPWEMGYLRAGGGLCSNVADLSQMMLQQMDAYQTFDNPKEKPALYLSEETVSWGKTGYPYYGLGIMEFNKLIDTTMIHIGHGGDVDGFASVYIFFPKQEVGIVMLTSSGGEWFSHLEWAIQDILLEIQPRETIKLDNPNFASITGVYQFKNGDQLTISQKDDHIITQLANEAQHEAYPYESNKFYYPNFPVELVFENGQLQRIDQLGNSRFAEREKDQLSIN